MSHWTVDGFGPLVTPRSRRRTTWVLGIASVLLVGLLVVRLANSDERLPVNLGNPVELTILEFGERIQALMGIKTPIVHEPLPSDDPKRRQPNIAKAKKILGWEPKVGLEEGLRETVEYFRAKLTAAR